MATGGLGREKLIPEYPFWIGTDILKFPLLLATSTRNWINSVTGQSFSVFNWPLPSKIRFTMSKKRLFKATLLGGLLNVQLQENHLVQFDFGHQDSHGLSGQIENTRL